MNWLDILSSMYGMSGSAGGAGYNGGPGVGIPNLTAYGSANLGYGRPQMSGSVQGTQNGSPSIGLPSQFAYGSLFPYLFGGR